MTDSSVQIILSGAIFIIAYTLIILDKFDRTVVAIGGAVLMILLRILNQESAFKEIDYNTLGLLIGMMVIVLITKKSGVFEYLTVKFIKIAKGKPVKIIVYLSLITAILSAMLDNVTTILLIISVTLNIARDLRLNPVPFIIAEVISSNIGGTATLIGDPPNIMIASAAGLTFMDFIKINALIVIPILFLTLYILILVYRKKLVSIKESREKIMQMNENSFIKDKILLIKSLTVLGITTIGFMLHGILHYEPATIAIAGAVALVLFSKLNPEKILHYVEWKTIFFFAGLFMMVGGIKETGIVKMLAEGVLNITHDNLLLTTMSILWVSAIASAIIDNIPFVATTMPIINDVGTLSGIKITPLWWALSLGACLGGNGSLVGASANVIAAGIAEEHGHKITYIRYFKIAFPLMIMSIVICTVYLYLRYFIL